MLVREVGSPVSTGITASAPYVIEKEVSLVEWFDKPIAHLEALPPQPFESSSLFFRPLTMDLLVASA